MQRTISRMAVSGLPAATLVVLGICLVGVTAIALAMGLGPRSSGGRSFLAVAGGALLVAAAVRLDPGSIRATIEHDSAAAIAVVALAAAPLAFARSHGRVSLAFGAAEVGVLLVGLVLLPTTFAAWGLWERAYLALPVVWMFVMSWRLLRTSRMKVSAEETVKAAAASQSNGGEYVPTARVRTANE